MKIVSHISVDIESTGLDHNKCDIIQLAAVEVNTDNTLGRTFNCFMAPAKPQNWTSGAENVHKIPLAKALTFPPRRNGLILFMHWLAPHLQQFPLGFIYHGLNLFDYSFVKSAFINEDFLEKFEKAFRKELVVSTTEMSRQYLNLHNHKLNTVCERLGIPLNHHEALSDAVAAAKIYCRLNQDFVNFKNGMFQ